jgi:pyrroloquinoline-quinone synthase
MSPALYTRLNYVLTEEYLMSTIQQLNAAVEKWDLLKSPFYQAWSEGTLPIGALKAYAEEYGAFISLMPLGWEVQDDEHTAEEEVEHTELWEKFAASLGTKITDANIPAVQELIAKTRDLFKTVPEALGALYAFEVQQPATAQSKLKGLRQHYSLSTDSEPYFEVHSNNHHEAEKLTERIAALSPEDQKRALMACELMSKALWDALDGIYEPHKKCSGRCGSC